MDEPKLIKKKSFTERIIGKKGIFISVAIVLVITLLVGSSYSLLTNFDTPNNAIIIKEGDMRMTVNNTEGQIKLKNRSYVSDTEGLKKETPTIISFSNTGNCLITKYEVILKGIDKTNLDSKYLRYAYSTDSGVSYSEPANLDSSGIIYTGYNLVNNKSKIIYLKVWIDEKAGSNGVNKNFYGSIDVKLYDSGEVPYASNIVKQTLDKEKGISRIAYNKYQFLESDVNNYVKFNHELWRIIGIYTDNDNDYLRIVRDKELGSDILLEEYDGVKLDKDEDAIKNFLNSESDKKNNRGYLSYLNNNSRSMIKGREFELLNSNDSCKWMDYEINSSLIRPVINLLPNVIITSGEGSKDMPYELGL